MNETVFLPDAIFAEAEAVGLRLRACASEAIGRCFGSTPTARELSQATGVDGVICKRMIKILRDGPGAIVLTHAPSPVNLREFAALLEEHHGLGPLEAFALRDAVGKFEKLITAFGGAKGDLTKALRAAEHAPSSAGPSAHDPAFAVLSDHGAIVSVPEAEPLAAMTDLNPLALAQDDFIDALIEHAIGGRIVTWSGTLADNLFARDPSVWSGEATEALARLSRAAAPKLKAAGVRWLLRPHCRHTLCDTQRTVSFLRTHLSGPAMRESIGLALDPVAMLEDTMLDASAGGGATPSDYIGRAIRTLGPVSDLLLVSGVLRAEPDGQADFENMPLPVPCAIDAGLVAPADLIRAIREVAPFIARIVPISGQSAQQIEQIRAGLASDESA